MKKLALVLFSSIMAGMLMGLLSSTYAAEECKSTTPKDVVCCKPDGKRYCGDSAHITNSCGSPIATCDITKEYCSSDQPDGSDAYCKANGPCNPDAPVTSCQDSTIATNHCGKLDVCSSSEQCIQGQGCKPKNTQCVDECKDGHFSTWNACTNQVTPCPGGCKDNKCQVDKKCPSHLAALRKCSWYGAIMNGCDEEIEHCEAKGLKCVASTTEQSCFCAGGPTDQCSNDNIYPGLQLTVPVGKIQKKDASGKLICVDPDIYNKYECKASGWSKVDVCSVLTDPQQSSYNPGAQVCATASPQATCKVQCTSPEAYNPKTNTCCAAGQSYDPTTQSCVDKYNKYECKASGWSKVDVCSVLTDPQQSSYNPGAQVCATASPQATCKVQCTSPEAYNPKTNTCCAAGQSYDPTTQSCVDKYNKYECKASGWSKVDVCSVLTSPLGISYDQGASVCSTASPQATCKVQCTSPEAYNPKTNTCCAAGQSYDPVTEQCQSLCLDPKANNVNKVGSCIYSYSCTNGYQCIKQPGGPYSTSNCDNKCFSCPALQKNVGEKCDDGNPATKNDSIVPGCKCEGQTTDTDICAPKLCTDPVASNYRGAQPCTYDRFACVPDPNSDPNSSSSSDKGGMCLPSWGGWGTHTSSSCDGDCNSCGNGAIDASCTQCPQGQKMQQGICQNKCLDCKAENFDDVGPCKYAYTCSTSYQCVQQKGGEFVGDSSCKNACKPTPSCDGLSIRMESTADGALVGYDCKHSAGGSAMVQIVGATSSSLSLTAAGKSFVGVHSLPQGKYKAKCTIDGSIDYRVDPLYVPSVQKFKYTKTYTSSYGTESITNICVEESSLGPIKPILINKDIIVFMPAPIPYCPSGMTNAQSVPLSTNDVIGVMNTGSCMTEFTVVAKSNCDPTSICCNGSCGGGGTYKFCGDGAVNASAEQCDDGLNNGSPTSTCSPSCTNKPSLSAKPGSSSIYDKKDTIFSKGSLEQGMIDPPDVMVGEYVPFWWNFDKKSHVELVKECPSGSQGDSSKLYVLNEDSIRPPYCEFYIDAAGIKSASFRVPCDTKKNYNTVPLLKSYLGGSSSIVQKSYADSIGASYLTPAQRDSNKFDKLGEYRIVWDKTIYTACERHEKKTITAPDTIKTTVYYTLPDHVTVVDDSDNYFLFTVSQPYMIQKGSALTMSKLDADVLSRIVGSSNTEGNVGNSLLKSFSVIEGYKRSSNADYLVSDFVTKYKGLAVFTGEVNNSPMKKVGNDDIYVYGDGDLTITGIPTDSANQRPLDLGTKTIIVPNGNLTIRGSIGGKLMFVVPNGVVRFQSISAKSQQRVDAIIIAKGYDSKEPLPVKRLKNDNLANETWHFDGRLLINGTLLFLTDPLADGKGYGNFEILKNLRRSSLAKWFTTTDKKKVILDGGSLTIVTDPRLLVELPPAANELMTKLDTYK